MFLEINNPQNLRADEKRLNEILSRAREKFRLKDRFQVSVSIVPRSEILRLNSTQRGIEKETDVLSFSYILKEFPDHGGIVEIGDVVICAEVAKKQAIAHKHSFAEELAFLFAHGLLHIIGYNDETDQGVNEMNLLARDLLAYKEANCPI